MTTRRFMPLALAALLAAAPASAQVAYGNGPPNGQAGYDIFNDFRSADDFTVTSQTAFDVVRFWGIMPVGIGFTPTVFWQVLDDAGGIPGATAVASGSTLAQAMLRGSLGYGFDSWQFDLTVGPQLVGPGSYWLALHDGAIGSNTDSGLLWEMTDTRTGAPFTTHFIPTNEWGSFDGDLAFELRTSPVQSVPEPSTLALVATGLIGVAGASLRRRRRTS